MAGYGGWASYTNTYLPHILIVTTVRESECARVCVWVCVRVCARVSDEYTHSFGFERRLDLLVLQFFPVYIAEEGVLLDVPLPFWTTAQTLTWMFGHELKTTHRHEVTL